MSPAKSLNPQSLARWVGWSLIGTIAIGLYSAMVVADGIDINLSADVVATARNMLDAETQLRAKAYVGGLVFSFQAIIGIGLFLLLRKSGELLAGWSLFVSLAASVLGLLGAVFAMNAAEIAGDPAYGSMAGDTRLMLAGLQATSDYTSFHLGLILSSAANAGFFYLFLRSKLIPQIIAGWGLFASIFVVTMIVGRDFVPMLGHGTITAAFLLSNLVALASTGLYLGIRGVRSS
ncbi:MAG: DUF4386 domain-containing protein [Sphingomonadaceae bacterium]|nr:DUF4386 domain-containing protein [Sphingomonadaceae bacterium]